MRICFDPLLKTLCATLFNTRQKILRSRSKSKQRAQTAVEMTTSRTAVRPLPQLRYAITVRVCLKVRSRKSSAHFIELTTPAIVRVEALVWAWQLPNAQCAYTVAMLKPQTFPTAGSQ